MKRIFTTLTLSSFILGTAACGSPEEQAVKLMEEMGNIMDANKEDCDKMGDELKKFVDKNGETLKNLQNALKGGDEAKEKAMKEKYADRIGSAMGKVMEGSMKCATNEKVGAAMASMRPANDKPPADDKPAEEVK